MSNNLIKYTKYLGNDLVFSTFDALKILMIKRGRLVQWMRDGYLPVGTQVSWGSGVKTVFKAVDLYAICLFKNLVEMGLSRDLASKYIEGINWKDVIYGNEGYLFIPKHTFYSFQEFNDELDELDEFDQEESEIPSDSENAVKVVHEAPALLSEDQLAIRLSNLSFCSSAIVIDLKGLAREVDQRL
ncbi:hypothetical protein D3OALGA1CA_1996 [Olavius algarvensis associated proteobacterium Delta 3]|nr:hypothetical protein D3OALGA1CA_1996 [Olavius algarvensis associated proteobacterium Delta 3]